MLSRCKTARRLNCLTACLYISVQHFKWRLINYTTFTPREQSLCMLHKGHHKKAMCGRRFVQTAPVEDLAWWVEDYRNCYACYMPKRRDVAASLTLIHNPCSFPLTWSTYSISQFPQPPSNSLEMWVMKLHVIFIMFMALFLCLNHINVPVEYKHV